MNKCDFCEYSIMKEGKLDCRIHSICTREQDCKRAIKSMKETLEKCTLVEKEKNATKQR